MQLIMELFFIYVVLVVGLNALDGVELRMVNMKGRMERIEDDVVEIKDDMAHLTTKLNKTLQFLSDGSIENVGKTEIQNVDSKLLNNTNLEERVQVLEFQTAE